MMDYVVRDGRAAGFEHVMIVTRAEIVDAVRASLAWAERLLHVEYVLQRTNDVPAGAPKSAARTKPWGTSHAVLTAERAARGAFVVVNADDYYGARSYEIAAGFLRDASADFAVVGFPLRETLSVSGGVNRALLERDDAGWLRRVEEISDIVAREGALHGRDRLGRDRVLPGDALVSMNMWAFTPTVFPSLREGFTQFVAAHGMEKDAEFLLPDAVAGMMDAGDVRVRVLSGGGPWCGVTYPSDVPAVRAALRAFAGANGGTSGPAS
jgi:hypothetical protein